MPQAWLASMAAIAAALAIGARADAHGAPRPWLSAARWGQEILPPRKPIIDPGQKPHIEPPQKPVIDPPIVTPPLLPDASEPRRPGRADKLVKITTATDARTIAPGQKFHVAFIFDIEPGWHIYWKNSGASGGPTEIKLAAPPGYEVGGTLYPRPKAIKGEEGVTYGYEKKAVIFVEVTAPIERRDSAAVLNADISFLVCKDVCLIGRATRMINAGALSAAADPAAEAVINEYKKRLPKPLKSLGGAQTSFDGSRLTLRLPAQGHRSAELFPSQNPGVIFGDPETTVEGDFVMVTVPVTVSPQDALGQPLIVAGVIGLGSAATDPSYDFEIPVTEHR